MDNFGSYLRILGICAIIGFIIGFIALVFTGWYHFAHMAGFGDFCFGCLAWFLALGAAAAAVMFVKAEIDF